MHFTYIHPKRCVRLPPQIALSEGSDVEGERESPSGLAFNTGDLEDSFHWLSPQTATFNLSNSFF